MLNLIYTIGPVHVQLNTDERLSFEGIETMMNKTLLNTLTLFNGHLAGVVKYENYDDSLCPHNEDECSDCSIDEEI